MADKHEAQQRLLKQIEEVERMDKFYGKAKILKSLKSRVAFTCLYKLTEKELDLLVDEFDKDMAGLDISTCNLLKGGREINV